MLAGARERGVVFDIGHGMGSLSFETATAMLEQGFLPDVISSDVHTLCIDGPAFDLLRTMSKFTALGMRLEDVIRPAPVHPARAIGRTDPRTAWHPGAVGDAAVLELRPGAYTHTDSLGARPFQALCSSTATGNRDRRGMVAERRSRERLLSGPGPSWNSKAESAFKGSMARASTPRHSSSNLRRFEHNLHWRCTRLQPRRGIALRPHAKTTHNRPPSAWAQMDVLVPSASLLRQLGEARRRWRRPRYRSNLLLTHITLSSAAPEIERYLALHQRLADLATVVDDAENVAALAAAAAGSDRRIRLLIDVDIGTHRFGVTGPAQALALAAAIRDAPGLELAGIQGYAGHVQAMPSYAERRNRLPCGARRPWCRARRPGRCRPCLPDRHRAAAQAAMISTTSRAPSPISRSAPTSSRT
jgi:D-serine deaminase-like pyridoxal phosphate-dependent protein